MKQRPNKQNLKDKCQGSNRIGDIAEMKACAWLMEQGYDVFRNVSSVGPADLMVWDLDTLKVFPVDVKNTTKQIKVDGSITYTVKRQGQKAGVEYLHYCSEDDTFHWNL